MKRMSPNEVAEVLHELLWRLDEHVEPDDDLRAKVRRAQDTVLRPLSPAEMRGWAALGAAVCRTADDRRSKAAVQN